jgi:hypothetical protein
VPFIVVHPSSARWDVGLDTLEVFLSVVHRVEGRLIDFASEEEVSDGLIRGVKPIKGRRVLSS